MNTPQLEEGYTRIANEILEKLCLVKLSAYQTRIVFCIIRKTYGFNKKEDWISNSQFVDMTKLRPSHISRSISELVMMKLVTKRGNKIAFQKDWRLWKKLPNGVRRHDIVTKRGKTVTKRGNSLLPNGGYTKETITKETIQKKYTSLAEIDSFTITEISGKYQVPESFVVSKLDDMTNWLGANGRRYKDYRLALMNWVKKDSLKIKKEYHDKSKIVFIDG